jgi:hypothetical protein
MEINRKTMELVGEMERQLQTFHGFRHLWAELIANHELCGVTKEKLEKSQSERLTAALGVGCTIANLHGISWVGTSRERDFIRELADEECSYKDNCPAFGTRHGRCLSCSAREVLKPLF